MTNLLLIATFFVITTAFHTLGNILGCLAFGIKINKIQFFYGKEIVKIDSKVIPFVLGWIPTGGSVSYDAEKFKELFLLKRLTIHLSGPAIVLISTIAFTNFNIAISSFFEGFNQIITGTFSPLEKGSYFLSYYFQLLSSESYSLSFAIFASKFTSFNLLPLPSLTGGDTILEVFSSFTNEKIIFSLKQIGLFLCLIFISIWSIAFLYSLS